MSLPLSGVTGLGIDIERIDRWHQPDSRLFTDREIAYCRTQARPAESFAGRWCAKEAVVKAFGKLAKVGIRDVEIRAGEDGEPFVVLPERLAELGFRVLVSISHDSAQAVAVAALVSGPADAGSGTA